MLAIQLSKKDQRYFQKGGFRRWLSFHRVAAGAALAVAALSLISIMLLSGLNSLTIARTFRVPQDFPSIQAAINNAQPGDVIEVDAQHDPYKESIMINVNNVVIRSINGVAIIDGMNRDSAVLILGEAVEFTGFEITNAKIGIWVVGDNNKLENNIIKDGVTFGIGVSFKKGRQIIGSKANTIKDNLLQGGEIGIILWGSSENTIENNTINECRINGINLQDSSNTNIIRNNLIERNDFAGIGLNSASNNNIVEGNTIQETSKGLTMYGVGENLVKGNIIKANEYGGIILVASPLPGSGHNGNTIQGNILEGNGFNIILISSEGNHMEENWIMGGKIGIELVNSGTNSVITRNEIKENELGIEVKKFRDLTRQTVQELHLEGLGHVGSNEGYSIVQNNIAGNSFGVRNGAEFILNATQNWWGDPSGPSGEGPGKGDIVSSLVNFSPWLTAPISIPRP